MNQEKVIFARVGSEVRHAVGAYAGARGMTLTAAVSDLLKRGLEAASDEDSVSRLEQSVGELRLSLAERDRLLQEERGRSAATEQREQYLQHFVSQLDTAPIGRCPQIGCQTPISPIDLVVRRTCKRGHGLGQVLEKASQAPGMNSGEVLAVIGGLGLVLALLAASVKK
jgi:hypothetical protein